MINLSRYGRIVKYERPESGARAATTTPIAKARKPPSLVVYSHDDEQRVLSAVTAISGGAEIPSPRSVAASLFAEQPPRYSVHGSFCSEMLSTSSTSMPR
jgi:hypothetical protein